MSRTIVRLLVAASAVALVFISSAPWQDTFVRLGGGLSVAAVLAIGAVLSVVVPIVVARSLGRSLVWSLPASVLVYVAAALSLAVEPGFSLSALADGYSDALARLLQSTPPVVVDNGTLIPAFTLVWVTGAVMSEMLNRTRAVLGVLVAPLVAFGLAYAVGARLEQGAGFNSGSVGWAFAALGAAGILVALRRTELDPPSVVGDGAPEGLAALRSPAIAAVLLVAAGLLALAVVPRLPGVEEDPAVIDRKPPVNIPVPDSPAEVMAAYRATDGGLLVSPVNETVLLRVSVDKAFSGYLPLANLDTYDGGGWRFDRLYNPTGLEVPSAQGVAGEPVAQTIEILEPLPLAEQWMPALDRPVVVPPFAIAGDDDTKVQALFDASTGMLLAPRPLTSGTAYSVDSRQALLTLDGLDDGAAPGEGGVIPPRQTVTPLSDPSNIQAAWTSRIESGLDQPLSAEAASLRQLRDWLRDNFAVTDDNFEVRQRELGIEPDPVVRSLALLAINDKVFGGDAQGTPEQLATIYVLLARQLGVPARLSTGFRLVDDSNRDRGLPAGSYEATGAQAWTWAEVLVGGSGWVVVDPTPPVDQEVPPPTTTTIPEGSKKPDIIEEELTTILSNPVADPPPVIEPTRSLLVPLLLGLAALVLAALLLAALLRRRLRRRARRRGDPRDQVVGAWQEALDQLDEADLSGLGSLAGTEVSAVAAERFGPGVGAPVAGVATLATPAVFSSAPVKEPDAKEAWANLEAARSAIRRQLSPRQRLRATLRSLRPRRH